ncbi:MAG: SAM-dependent methyltransferase [Actinomycetota bacterium]|nr:SAM-dependent methyltransferase [Actinomycetota bacterium]
MPKTPPSIRWRAAWQQSLYGDDGFFRSHSPVDHFRTSVNSSELFAEAVWRLLHAEGLGTVVDVGAGRGELLRHLHRLSGGTLNLSGVEIADRPGDLPPAIGWTDNLPDRIDGLLIANEWLDNIPCDVVEVDEKGRIRFVLVDPSDGREALGEECSDPWLDRWWPLTEPGDRAEIGAPRDEAWADAVSRVNGIALAVDYGHTRADRPILGSLRSYRQGVETDVVPDGTRDVTAHVAVDAVAAAARATISTQSESLRQLGVSGARPPIELATADPQAYVRALAAASASAELTARGGWGEFRWMRTDTRTAV